MLQSTLETLALTEQYQNREVYLLHLAEREHVDVSLVFMLADSLRYETNFAALEAAIRDTKKLEC